MERPGLQDVRRGVWSGSMQDDCQELGVTWTSGNVDGHVEWQHAGRLSGAWSDLGFRKC